MKALSFLPATVLAAMAMVGNPALGESRSGSLVSIEASRPETTEPAPLIRVIPGEFTIRREGGHLDQSLMVWIAYSGTATPGKDYRTLPERVEFAPGQLRVTLQVQGIDDDELERDETVVARLHDPTLGPLPLFDIDPEQGSASITIHDSDSPDGAPVVSIKATRHLAEETAAPLRRLNLVGEFTVSRAVATRTDLAVWIHLSGTATPGEDYELLPRLVRIPAGERSVSFPVTAVFDRLPEGIETVIATVSNCPPEGILGPCHLFKVDELNQSDTVFIREDGISVASLHITDPADGGEFAFGEPVPIRATAIHLESYISRLEFWADDSRIGDSEIFFVRAPDPGTPVQHEFTWQNAPAGSHVLTARTRLDETRGDTTLVSSPVRITVSESGGNKPARVAIASPSDGDQIPAGNPIEIVVEARDPDGYIPKVELFANGLKIGEMNISFFVEPPPGQPQAFTFTWEHPMPGRHVLTTRVTDNDKLGSESAPVNVAVISRDTRPVVTAVATDAFAVEPEADQTVDTATFRIRRHGSTIDELVVHYTLSGRAANGVDYEKLPGSAVIPAGSSSTGITIVPLADRNPEDPEPVRLELAADPSYLLDSPHQAYAMIRDHPWPRPAGPPRSLRLADGLVHLCFPAPPGDCFRLEGTADLRNWTTLLCLAAVDGQIHFVTEPGPGIPERYFRIAPEPDGRPGE